MENNSIGPSPSDSTDKKDRRAIPWPHASLHCLGEEGAYFVTVGTYKKEIFFQGKMRLDQLQKGLLTAAEQFGWHLEAWCVFANHYHFVAYSPGKTAKNLSPMLSELHTKLARWINLCDQTPGRKVWHNYWETHLTFINSYHARLHYTHANAVHHGIVTKASDYPWCSAAWFERTASPALVKTIYGFQIDKITVMDDFFTEG